jgi:glutaredoxin
VLTLYGRSQCHLCDEMASALARLGAAFRKVDVDTDEALRRRYGDAVPVLVDAVGRELCRHRLDEAAVRARLAVE